MVMTTCFNIENLQVAWQRCLRDYRRGFKSWGHLDVAGIETFRCAADDNLRRLSEALKSGDYEPSRPIKYYLPKPAGTVRTKTILSIEDAIVYQLLVDWIALSSIGTIKQYNDIVFSGALVDEAELAAAALLAKRSPKFDFLVQWEGRYRAFTKVVNSSIDSNKNEYPLETDISGFYDCISHFVLRGVLEERFALDTEFCDFLFQCLDAWSGPLGAKTPGLGIPQGPQASAYLANLYLLSLDEHMKDSGCTYYRYVDDMRVFAGSEAELQKTLVDIDVTLKSLGLVLNSSKTKISRLPEARSAVHVPFFDTSVSDGMEADVDGLILSEELLDQEGVGVLVDDKAEALFDSKSFRSEIETDLRALELEVELHTMEVGGSVVLGGDLLGDAKFCRGIAWRFRDLARRIDRCSEEDVGGLPELPDWTDLWIALSLKHKHLANHFNWCIRIKGVTDSDVGKLMSALDSSKGWEWVQVEFRTTLRCAQRLNPDRCLEIFKNLEGSPSSYARISIYSLLIKHIRQESPLLELLLAKMAGESNLLVIAALMDSSRRRDDNLVLFRRFIQKIFGDE